MEYALTYHVEGERDLPSARIYQEIERQVLLADRLGYHAAWFAEHHAHAHVGHMPHPLLFALHLAARTSRIQLGSAVLCVNLHHPVLVAEQIAVADVLSGGRMSLGLGSGSTPSEIALYAAPDLPPDGRRARFEEVLDVLEAAWTGEPFERRGAHLQVAAPAGLLPVPDDALLDRLWIGANSLDSAHLAGRRGYGLQLSNLRTVPDLRALIGRYREGRAAAARPIGPERIAASAPCYVAPTDARALAAFQPALDLLLRENRRQAPTPDRAWDARPGDVARPATPREHLAALRFAVGDPARVADELLALREQLPFTTINLRPRWLGLPPDRVAASIELFATAVRPALDAAWR